MRRIVLSLTALALFIFSACGAQRARENFSTASSQPATPSNMPSASPALAEKALSQPSTESSNVVKISDDQALPEKTGVERKIIRNAELTIETPHPEEAFRQVSSLAESKG